MPRPSSLRWSPRRWRWPVARRRPSDASQLRLFGMLSRGAVIGMADGTQRFVPVGREIVPGVTLRGVDVHQAILATPSGEVRLGFDVAAQPQAAARLRSLGPATPKRRRRIGSKKCPGAAKRPGSGGGDGERAGPFLVSPVRTGRRLSRRRCAAR